MVQAVRSRPEQVKDVAATLNVFSMASSAYLKFQPS
jgi:hypothetical protein